MHHTLYEFHVLRMICVNLPCELSTDILTIIVSSDP
jgi:hypothetical protein